MKNNKLTTNFITVLLLAIISFTFSYKVQISDLDDFRQACSGIWSSKDASINITFDETLSKGQAALAIWEWGDIDKLGRLPSNVDEGIYAKSYVCTSTSLQQGLCNESELGKFIVNSDNDDNSIYTTAVRFNDIQVGPSTTMSSSSDDVDIDKGGIDRRELYKANRGPFEYKVEKSGFYCVGTVPITLLGGNNNENSHGSFVGLVEFKDSKFSELPAADIPKLTFYLVMIFVYIFTGAIWGYMCYQHRGQLLMIQHFISGLISFLIIEMTLNFIYYKHLNDTPPDVGSKLSTFLLCLCAIFAAIRSALSLGLIISVSLGWAVVRPNLDPSTIKKIIALVGAHAIFGIVNAIGTVIISFEEASLVTLLFIIIPLAVTQSIALLWTLYSLNHTIRYLDSKNQRFKLGMYKNVYRILIAAQFIIIFFFGLATFTFSSRLEEDYEPLHWKSRWFLIDGWTSLLYYTVLIMLSWLWRPSSHHSRLALSDEIAVDENEAEEYEIAERGYNHQQQTSNNNNDDDHHYDNAETVFAIDDEDEDEFKPNKKDDDYNDGSRYERERDELLGNHNQNRKSHDSD